MTIDLPTDESRLAKFISSPHMLAKRLNRGLILTMLGLASTTGGFWILGKNLRVSEENREIAPHVISDNYASHRDQNVSDWLVASLRVS